GALAPVAAGEHFADALACAEAIVANAAAKATLGAARMDAATVRMSRVRAGDAGGLPRHHGLASWSRNSSESWSVSTGAQRDLRRAEVGFETFRTWRRRIRDNPATTREVTEFGGLRAKDPFLPS